MGRGVDRLIAEHMGVAGHQLRRDAGGDVVDRPRLARVLLGDPGVEHDLQQHVAELLAHRRAVTGLDRLDRLVGLLGQVGDQRLVGLLGVPRASAGRAQPVHDGDELEQRLAARGGDGARTAAPAWAGPSRTWPAPRRPASTPPSRGRSAAVRRPRCRSAGTPRRRWPSEYSESATRAASSCAACIPGGVELLADRGHQQVGAHVLLEGLRAGCRTAGRGCSGPPRRRSRWPAARGPARPVCGSARCHCPRRSCSTSRSRTTPLGRGAGQPGRRLAGGQSLPGQHVRRHRRRSRPGRPGTRWTPRPGRSRPARTGVDPSVPQPASTSAPHPRAMAVLRITCLRSVRG